MSIVCTFLVLFVANLAVLGLWMMYQIRKAEGP